MFSAGPLSCFTVLLLDSQWPGRILLFKILVLWYSWLRYFDMLSIRWSQYSADNYLMKFMWNVTSVLCCFDFPPYWNYNSERPIVKNHIEFCCDTASAHHDYLTIFLKSRVEPGLWQQQQLCVESSSSPRSQDGLGWPTAALAGQRGLKRTKPGQ